MSASEFQQEKGKLEAKIGAKITGSGKGGNIIIFSLLPEEEHKKLIKGLIFEKYTIHFDSSIHDFDEWKSKIEGVREEIKGNQKQEA